MAIYQGQLISDDSELEKLKAQLGLENGPDGHLQLSQKEDPELRALLDSSEPDLHPEPRSHAYLDHDYKGPEKNKPNPGPGAMNYAYDKPTQDFTKSMVIDGPADWVDDPSGPKGSGKPVQPRSKDPYAGTGGTTGPKRDPYTGTGGTSPAAPAARALLAKLKKPQAFGGHKLGPSDDPTQEATQTPPGGPSASLPSQVASMVAGASPRPPQATEDDSDLTDAQDRADRADAYAQFQHGMARAADIGAGTHFNEHVGDDIRARGAQGVKDVMERRNQKRLGADQRRQEEDQGFQRQANDIAAGADRRAQQTFDTGAAKNREWDTPGTRTAKAMEVLFRQKRPREAAGMDFSNQTANTLKEALSTKDDPIPKPAGAGGGGAKQIAALSKLLPPETVNVMAGTQRVKQMVEKAGGWDKINGVGLVEGRLPNWLLSDEGKAFRQEVGNLAATHLQSKGGKAITDSEERIILGKIQANPGGATPAELQRGMRIIERNTAANARQAMAAVPAHQRSEILNAAGGSHPGELEGWMNQDQVSPSGASGKPTPGPGYVRGKSKSGHAGWYNAATHDFMAD